MEKPQSVFGKEDALGERRTRAFEGSVAPSFVGERGVDKYEKLLGVSIDVLRGKTVLDIGSGPEEIFSKEAKRKGVKVFSLSPELKHEDVRKTARGNWLDVFKSGRWQKKSVGGIVQMLPFRDEAFDAEVSLFGGMHYLPYLEGEYRAAFLEIIRTLKPGGSAYLYPVNIRIEHDKPFKKMLEELSPEVICDIVLVKKNELGNNMYRVTLTKRKQ